MANIRYSALSQAGLTAVSQTQSVDYSVSNINTNLRGQWDVNANGRTDNDFYENINGTVESSTLATLDTARGYGAMSYNGNGYYTQINGLPTGLSSSFADSNFTIAVRYQDDNTAGGTTSLAFVADASNAAARVGMYLDTGNGTPSAQIVDGDVGQDLYINDFTNQNSTTENVLTFRREGATNHDLWFNNSQVKTNTTTTPAQPGAIWDTVVFGKGGMNNTWYLEGDIVWVAIWDRALTDEEIQELDDTHNPWYPYTSVSNTQAVDYSVAARPSLDNAQEYEVYTQSSPYTPSYTVGTGVNVLYAVIQGDSSHNAPNTTDITAFTYNGSSLTKVYQSWDDDQPLSVYRLINPTTGANNLSLTFNNDPQSIKMTVFGVKNANTSNPEGLFGVQNNAASTSIAATANTSADGLLVGIAGINSTGDQLAQISTSDTEFAEFESGSTSISIAYTNGTGSADTINWTTFSTRSTGIAFNIYASHETPLEIARPVVNHRQICYVGSGQTSPYTTSYTVEDNITELYYVSVGDGAADYPPHEDVTAITYNSVAMTLVYDGSSAQQPFYVYRLANPSTGSNTFSLSFNNGPITLKGALFGISNTNSSIAPVPKFAENASSTNLTISGVDTSERGTLIGIAAINQDNETDQITTTDNEDIKIDLFSTSIVVNSIEGSGSPDSIVWTQPVDRNAGIAFNVYSTSEIVSSVSVEYELEESISQTQAIDYDVNLSPTITNVSPSSFGDGQTNVVVTGTNFGASQGTSTLDIAGIVQTGLTWTDTQITIPVVNVAGIENGPHYVRVDIN